MSEAWLRDLEPLGTDADKPFLETAPWLVVVFKRAYEEGPEGEKRNNYYVTESVGLATGLFLTAAHQAGLATLTHTPSPMNFLAELLERPANERAFLLIPVGHPAEDCRVPDLRRKPLDQVLVHYGPDLDATSRKNLSFAACSTNTARTCRTSSQGSSRSSWTSSA